MTEAVIGTRTSVLARRVGTTTTIIISAVVDWNTISLAVTWGVVVLFALAFICSRSSVLANRILATASIFCFTIVDGRASSAVLIERVTRGASAEARAGAAHVAYFLAAAVGRFAVIHRVA